jgi:hypothetical protein
MSVNNSFISERLSNLRRFFNEQLETVQKEIVDKYTTHINEFETTILDKTEEISGLSNHISELTLTNSKLNEENLNYQKVSLVKSLNSQLLDKDGEIKFLTSKIKQLNEQVQKIKGDRDRLEKENANMNLTLGREILNLIDTIVLPGLNTNSRIIVDNELIELSKKYDVKLDYVVNTFIFVTMLTNLNNFGNCLYAMATSLKKVGMWFKSPMIKKIKTGCVKSGSTDNIVIELCEIMSENDILSNDAIEAWATTFSNNEKLSKLNINEALFSVLLPTAAEEDVEEEDKDVSEEAVSAAEEEDVSEEAVSAAEEEDKEVSEADEEVSEADVETDVDAEAEEADVSEADKDVSEAEEADVSEAEDEEVSEADKDVSEEEMEFYELEIFNPKMKKKLNYLITDDELRQIYTMDEEEQPDEHVGRLVGKNNKAHFF